MINHKGITEKNGIYLKCKFPGCEKTFRSNFSMRRHYLVHTKIKTFECDQCGKKFALFQYLKEHLYIHGNKKPLVCGINGCKAKFRQSGKLSFHRKSHFEYFMRPSEYRARFEKNNKKRKIDHMTSLSENSLPCKSNNPNCKDISKNTNKIFTKTNIPIQTIKQANENQISLDNKAQETLINIKQNTQQEITPRFIQIVSMGEHKFAIKFGIYENEKSDKCPLISADNVPERFEELNYDKDIGDILINYLSNINSPTVNNVKPVLPIPGNLEKN